MNLIGFTENVSNRKVQQGDGAKEEETEPSLGSMTEKETGSGNDFLAASVRKTKIHRWCVYFEHFQKLNKFRWNFSARLYATTLKPYRRKKENV